MSKIFENKTVCFIVSVLLSAWLISPLIMYYNAYYKSVIQEERLKQIEARYEIILGDNNGK